MLFNQTVLAKKIHYIDTTPLPLVNKIATAALGETPFTLTRKDRVWFPGGGADLFLATTDKQSIFIKAKHKSLLIESKLESERDFSKISALENELAFFTELSSSPHIPKVLAHACYDNYVFLAMEALDPFEKMHAMDPEEQMAVYQSLERFVRELYEKGIVHTDIHEHNICFRGNTPVLIDFEEARRFCQKVPFAMSLDVTGAVGVDNVGEFPVRDTSEVPGLTCLHRLKKVICKIMAQRLPAYLSQCNFDNTSGYNLDAHQERDERIYQSIALPGLEITGQRPLADKRQAIVEQAIEYAAQALGRSVHVVDLGSNMGMISFGCASSANVASVQGLEADSRYVAASKVLAFYSGYQDKVRFTEYMTGKVPFQWRTDVLLLLSVYHHVPDKDAFLQEILATRPCCVLGEFATQERYYTERKGVESEIAHIKTTLGFSTAEVIAVSDDYQRPIVAFHNSPSGSIASIKKRNALAAKKAEAPGVGRSAAPSLPRPASVQQCLAWIKANSLKQLHGYGVAVSGKQQVPYPEVTGYCIPTLLDWGEMELAKHYASWLAGIQNPDGSFPGPNGNTPFAFDTGQVIRGVAAMLPFMPELEPALTKACDWVVATASPSGRIVLPANMADWSLGNRGSVNEAIHLYVLPGIEQAGAALGTNRYKSFVRRSLDYYISNCNLTNFLAPNMLLHFYCYIQEALFDLGAIDICMAGMRELADRQKNSGMVPAYAGASWICTPGLIQSGLVWLKLGDYRRADKALRVAKGLQSHTGGFPGGVGAGATYFPGEEISWAVKFYLDAIRLRSGVKDTENAPEFLYKARAEATADLPVEYTVTGGSAASQPEIPQQPVSPTQYPLIPLQRFAVRAMEREICALLHTVDAEEAPDAALITSLALGIPPLLDWGRRNLALRCASVVHNAISGQGLVFQPEDWLLPAHIVRAMRQPEIVRIHGTEQLKQLCGRILATKPRVAGASPLFLAALYEVRQSAAILCEEGLNDSTISLAVTHLKPEARVEPSSLFWYARAVGGLVSPATGMQLLKGVFAEGMDTASAFASLAWAAWEMQDAAVAENAFSHACSMLKSLQNTETSQVDHATLFAASSMFLNALSAKLRASFKEAFPLFHEYIDREDGRLAFVQEHLPAEVGARVLDLGCAKGRYLRHIHSLHPALELIAEDVHPDFRTCIPEGIPCVTGSLLRTAQDDASLDAILLCEVLEHCVDLQAAIGELYRILKENGRVIIVDKNLQALASWGGALPPWEQWFDPEKLAAAFRNRGFDIIRCGKNIPYEGNRRDGLFFGLVVQKTAGRGAEFRNLEEQKDTAPLVSLVLPTYNHLSYLPAAVDSILAQSYGNFELIIVDDGSEDGTGAFLDALAASKIRIVTGPNTRLPEALNRGFAEAKGALLSWTSADNICLPDFLEAMVGALNEYPQAGFAYGPFAYIDATGSVFDTLAGQELSLHASIASNTGVAAFMYRRSVAEQAGRYDPRIEGAEDWDMWLRLLEITDPVYVDAITYHYRYHDRSMTASIPEKVRAASGRVALRTLSRLEAQGGITKFFPQIEQCEDRKKALFHAYRELGSRMLYPHSFLRKTAFKYLQVAYGIDSRDLCTRANYAMALEYCGQHPEALRVLEGMQEQQRTAWMEPVVRFVTKSRGRIEDAQGTPCPVIVEKISPENELMQRVQAGRLIFAPYH